MRLTLRQQHAPAQRMDMSGVSPERLLGMNDDDVRRIELHSGKRRLTLGDVFAIESDPDADDELVIVPLDARLIHIGAGMGSGLLTIQGDAGDCAGRAMRGGTLRIEGNAGDYAGSGLAGGTLWIAGNAGDRAGAPMNGERRGQQGGLIHIRGNVGKRAGERQRRGYLIIEGDAGELLGFRMIAGTIYVGGKTGALACHGMRRGSVVLHEIPAELPSTIARNNHAELPFLRMLLNELKRLTNDTLPLTADIALKARYLGDMADDGRGEILVVPRSA